MTINCEKYKAVIPETTCLARIKILNKHQPGKNWGYGGRHSRGTYEGCEQGQVIYQKHLKGESIMGNEKICETCGKSKPATREYFKIANRAKDGLMKNCRECITRQAGKQGKKIVLDFTPYPELMSGLQEWADDNMRTVNNQIMFHLRAYILQQETS